MEVINVPRQNQYQKWYHLDEKTPESATKNQRIFHVFLNLQEALSENIVI